MRMIAPSPAEVREATGLRRFMLVTNPQRGQLYGPTLDTGEAAASQDEPVVVYSYLLDEDGPAYEPWSFSALAAALQWLSDNGVSPLEWSEVPDQMPGCRDDWLAPIRLDGPRWLRLIDGVWTEFEGPPRWHPYHLA